MNVNAHLFSVGDQHATARYFESAITMAGGNVSMYWDAALDPFTLPADDVFFYIDPARVWPIGLECSRCLTVAYLIDVHQDLQSRLRLAPLFDLVFIAQKDYLSAFQAAGHPNVQWLPLACSPSVHCPPVSERTFEVGFVGKSGARGSRRQELLEAVLSRFRTNNFRAWYPPIEMAKVYGQSKIVFNASINGDLNMRFFEALAAGALLITDRIQNGLDELFKEEVHYVAYSTLEEALEKINYYLGNDSAREKIAAKGQEVVLSKHTYLHRYQQILAERGKAGLIAPARKYSRDDLRRVYSEIFATLRQPARVLEVARRYGIGAPLAVNFVKSGARWLNSRVPITPNAVRAKFQRSWS